MLLKGCHLKKQETILRQYEKSSLMVSIARNFTIICTRAVGTRPSLAVFLKEQRQRALNGRCVARNKRIFATAAAAAGGNSFNFRTKKAEET